MAVSLTDARSTELYARVEYWSLTPPMADWVQVIGIAKRTVQARIPLEGTHIVGMTVRP